MFSAAAQAYAKCYGPDHPETLDAEERVAMCDDYCSDDY